ncbi:MAG: IPT/TIG domain-containing protein, partial [FCB group bacterium]
MMNWKNSIFVLTLSLVIFLFIYGCSKQSSNPITPPTNPVISSLSKIHGLPGSSMDINGSGFGSEQGTSYVDFNGTKASATDISSWSDTKITTKIPALATTGKLSVFANNTKSNELDFTVDTIVPGGPQIDNISPTNFAVGDIVTINGSNFGSMQLAGYVMFINKQPPNVSDYT